MKTIQKQISIHASPEKVFAFMDDLSKTGMHMSENSIMMMGSKLVLEQMPGPSKGVGATFHWNGKVMGMPVDIIETVTKWVENKEKVWETIGSPKIIILGWYRMRLKTASANEGTNTSLQIEYTEPKGWFYKILSFLFAGWYGRWCLNNMLYDTKRKLENSSL